MQNQESQIQHQQTTIGNQESQIQCQKSIIENQQSLIQRQQTTIENKDSQIQRLQTTIENQASQRHKRTVQTLESQMHRIDKSEISIKGELGICRDEFLIKE